MCFDHEADHIASLRIEHFGVNQKVVDHRVEPAQVHNVVDVTIEVVVPPACREALKMPIAGTQMWQLTPIAHENISRFITAATAYLP
jgi:hypothetical protein